MEKIGDKKWILLGSLVLFASLLIGGWAFFGSGFWQGSENINAKKSAEEKPQIYTTISGTSVLDESAATSRPLAVMIENHPDSRPQSGISEAEVVYEVVAEGGITRFLAIFQKNITSIGPVRSARMYYAEIADAWRALYAHVGGSPAALAKIQVGDFPGLQDVNEFYNEKYFERVKSRFAPHNVYTSSVRLQEFLKSKNFEEKLTGQSLGVEFIPVPGAVAPSVSRISIDFSKPEFLVDFQYDATQKKYLRKVAGLPDVDAGNKQQIAPASVLVLETSIKEIAGDKEGRMDVRTTGTGKLLAFSAGQKLEGTWSRQSGSQYVLRDVQGQTLKLSPGQVWIAIVSDLQKQVKAEAGLE